MNRKMTNEQAWKSLLNTPECLEAIGNDMPLVVSAEQMRFYREPRLMAKIDHSRNLPKVFRERNLSILPISRGSYLISKFENYEKFKSPQSNSVNSFPLRENLETLSVENITSESIALNAAMASGIMADFLDDETIVPTISGRMGSGSFSFYVEEYAGRRREIEVNNAQIEIDAAFEGKDFFSIVEAKMDIPDEGDFIIRQLYYPYRVWSDRIRKVVRPIFLTYSNGIYALREYSFREVRNYNSISLLRQSLYSIEDTRITNEEIEAILNATLISPEPEEVPFPQADVFPRIINLCELLRGRDLDKNTLSQEYDFDRRQSNYYADAARYLGLVDKSKDNLYHLSRKGLGILKMPYKKRQLAYCECIFSHSVFNSLMHQVFDRGALPTNDEIMRAMIDNNISLNDSTRHRRASTVRSWISWIVKLAES